MNFTKNHSKEISWYFKIYHDCQDTKNIKEFNKGDGEEQWETKSRSVKGNGDSEIGESWNRGLFLLANMIVRSFAWEGWIVNIYIYWYRNWHWDEILGSKCVWSSVFG